MQRKKRRSGSWRAASKNGVCSLACVIGSVREAFSTRFLTFRLSCNLDFCGLFSHAGLAPSTQRSQSMSGHQAPRQIQKFDEWIKETHQMQTSHRADDRALESEPPDEAVPPQMRTGRQLACCAVRCGLQHSVTAVQNYQKSIGFWGVCCGSAIWGKSPTNCRRFFLAVRSSPGAWYI